MPWLILPLLSNSKKGVDNLLESKLNKINDTINSNFVLSSNMKSIKSIFKRLLLIYLLFYIKHKRKIRSSGEETKLIFALNEEDFLHTCLFHTNPVPFWVLNITQSSDPAAAAAAPTAACTFRCLLCS